MRIIKKTNIQFLEKKSFALAISIVLIITGFDSLIMKGGPELSIDFTGGTVIQVLFEKSPEISQIRNKLISNGWTLPKYKLTSGLSMVINLAQDEERLLKQLSKNSYIWSKKHTYYEKAFKPVNKKL